mmetsp:Transcript_32581/g.36941  ORF Transcript_32581/g.36941 Transcript_32581/m.36941 type:complete len:378 (+) Transcript_32581:57-1190(+)
MDSPDSVSKNIISLDLSTDQSEQTLKMFMDMLEKFDQTSGCHSRSARFLPGPHSTHSREELFDQMKRQWGRLNSKVEFVKDVSHKGAMLDLVNSLQHMSIINPVDQESPIHLEFTPRLNSHISKMEVHLFEDSLIDKSVQSSSGIQLSRKPPSDLGELEKFVKVDPNMDKFCFSSHKRRRIQLTAPRRDRNWRVKNAIINSFKINQNATELDLFATCLLAEGAKNLAKMLQTNHSLIRLNLRACSIGNDGAKAIADALNFNNTITYLNLSVNNIDDDGCKAIAVTMKINYRLEKVKLSWNKIGNPGAFLLAEGLRVNSGIQNLSLEQNKIGGKGGLALAEALKVNPRCTRICLTNNRLSKVGKDTVRRRDLQGKIEL